MRLKRLLLPIGLASALFIPLLDLWIGILAVLFPRAGKPAAVAVLAAAVTAGCLVGLLRRVFRHLPRRRSLR